MQEQFKGSNDPVGRWRWIALFWPIALSLAGRSFGESITVAPVADTGLFAAYPDNNLGANLNFVVGGNGGGFPGRGLLRFGLAGRIPAGAVIQSATLSINVVVAPGGGGTPSVFDLRRVLTDWSEGTGTSNTGSPANKGETTWNNRFHPATPWSMPGGAISNDFSEIISASMLVSNFGSYTFSSTSNLVADVRLWLSNPATNFGWGLISQSEDIPFTARRLGTREDANNSPTLTVEYTLPVTPSIGWIKYLDSQVQIGFPGSTGQSYTVQYCDALPAKNWLTLSNVPPQNAATDLIVLDPYATNAQRYYRIGSF